MAHGQGQRGQSLGYYTDVALEGGYAFEPRDGKNWVACQDPSPGETHPETLVLEAWRGGVRESAH